MGIEVISAFLDKIFLFGTNQEAFVFQRVQKSYLLGALFVSLSFTFHLAILIILGWPGENFDFGNEQNDGDSTSGGCFCIRVMHMDKLKGIAAVGGPVRTGGLAKACSF
jgi:hypothetical protein